MEAMALFLSSLKSKETKRSYAIYLKKYMEILGINDLLSETNPRLIEEQMIEYIIKMKEMGKGYSTLHNYIATVVSFYRINDIVLNTKKISKFMPEQTRLRKDKAYTHEQISKLLEIADERMRVLILLLASSGIRIGSTSSLKLGNLEDNKLTVYENTREEYFTFITPECKKAIDNYIDMRSRYGEKIDDESLLIREQFDVRCPAKPRQIKIITITIKLLDLANRSGIRNRNSNVPIAHGFRKFFTTQLINSKVNPEIREMLLGHSIGLASAYYRPTEKEMYQEYMKAVNNLTINEENRLRIKVEKLEVEKTEFDRLRADIEMIKHQIKK